MEEANIIRKRKERRGKMKDMRTWGEERRKKEHRKEGIR